MKITHLDKSGKPIENSDVLKLLRQPNYFQSKRTFIPTNVVLSAVGTNLTYQVKP
jgi:hypothetical protein